MERIVLKISRGDGPITFMVPIVNVKISNETMVRFPSQKEKKKKEKDYIVYKKNTTIYTTPMQSTL